MNMKKKIVTVCLVACMALTAVAGGTLAYFTDNDTKTNTFTVGNVDIQLTEPKWVEEGNDSTTPVLKPDTTIAKDPTVTLINNSEDAWVFMEVTIGDKFNSLMDNYAGTAGQEDNVQLAAWTDGIDNEWEFLKTNEDGTLVYAHKTTMKNGDTSTLFNNIVVPKELTSDEVNKVKGTNATITLTAKAIQTIEGVNTAADAYAKLVEASK